MSPQTSSQPEATPKKPTASESVEGLIARKKAEKAAEGATAVQQSAEGVKSEVAEIISGAEKPKETVAERKGEGGQQGDLKAGQAVGGAKGATVTYEWKATDYPSELTMVNRVRQAIKEQIVAEMKKARKLEGRLTMGGAQEYTGVVARIRSLQETLSNLLFATIDFVKNLYQKYFTPDGKRKSVEEIQ